MSPKRRQLLTRAAAAIVLLPILATLNRSGVSPAPAFDHRAVIRFESVVLDNSAPGRRRLGALVYLGGWVLSSSNANFGGISAMHVGQGQVIALTDTGIVIRFPIPAADRGFVHGRVDQLLEGGRFPIKKEARDTESLAVAGAFAWVGFERRNIVQRYRVQDWESDLRAKPAAMLRWPRNGGSEGIARLRDGRFLIFSENARRRDGSSEVLLFDGDPVLAGSRYVRLGYRAPRGYYATDAAELPDRRLLILNRRFAPWGSFSAKLVVAPLPDAGGIVAGREVATLKAPVTVDNMEALSVTSEGGRAVVWIASDDNFSPPMQHTLLMKFALAE